MCICVCCSVLQCVVVWCSAVQCGAVCCSMLQCVAVWCSVVQCGVIWCSVLGQQLCVRVRRDSFINCSVTHLYVSSQGIRYVNVFTYTRMYVCIYVSM